MKTDQYFTTGGDVAAIKTRYRELAMEHYAAAETMATINAAYKIALENCDGQTSTGTDKRQHTYKYNETHEQAAIDKINAILASILPEGVTVWLIGTWIWVRGTKKSDTETRAKMNALKMRWSAKRGAWHWKAAGGGRRFYNKHSDLDGLAAKYGASKFKAKAA